MEQINEAEGVKQRASGWGVVTFWPNELYFSLFPLSFSQYYGRWHTPAAANHQKRRQLGSASILKRGTGIPKLTSNNAFNLTPFLPHTVHIFGIMWLARFPRARHIRSCVRCDLAVKHFAVGGQASATLQTIIDADTHRDVEAAARRDVEQVPRLSKQFGIFAFA